MSGSDSQLPLKSLILGRQKKDCNSLLTRLIQPTQKAARLIRSVGLVMSKYLTNKGIIVTAENNNKFTLEDILGNKVGYRDEESIENIVNKFKLKICAKENTNNNAFVNPSFPFSIIINDVKEYLLPAKMGLLLDLLRQIEDVSFQLVIGRQFGKEALSIYKQYNLIKVAIKEGHIDSNEYEKIVNDLRKQDNEIANALLIMDEIARLGDLIRTEVCHSEFCLINAIYSIRKHVEVENSRSIIKSGGERICYGFYIDSATWHFIDSIKSISTALDSLAKLVKFIFDIDVGKLPKKKNVLFGDMKHIKNWNGSLTTNSLTLLNNQFASLKAVINFRHHVTHNSGLFHSQNSIFIGRRTPAISNLDLIYGDLLMWDRNGDEFLTSQRTVGFFSQQNNAIEFANEALELTVKYTENIFRILRTNVLDKCNAAKIRELSLIRFNPNETITFSRHQTSELQQTVIV